MEARAKMTNEELYSDYKWIKVKRYQMDESKCWQERYKDLDEHHVKETSFLINEVRSLAKKLDELQTRANKVQRTQDWEDIIRTFIVMWFGFGVLVAMVIQAFIDEQTRFKNNQLILTIMLAVGAIVSLVFCRYKWIKEHEERSKSSK